MQTGTSCIATATDTATDTASKYAATQTVLQTSSSCLSCVQSAVAITEGYDNSCQE